MKKTNKTNYTILGMLAIRSMSGYEIQSMIKKTIANFWSESPGQIYPTLAMLLKEGAIASLEDSYNGKRKSKIYRLTAKGRKILQNWLPTAAMRHPSRDELLLKLFFGKGMTSEDCQKLVLKRKQNAEEYLQYLTSIKDHLTQEHKNDEDAPYWSITIDHGIHIVRAEIAWCHETLKKFNKKI